MTAEKRVLCKFNSLFPKRGDIADVEHPTNENKLYLIPRVPNAWTVFSASQVYGLSNTPQCSRFFPADTSSHPMGDRFKTSLCSYTVRTALSLKLLAHKNMFISTYQSTGGKQQPLEGNESPKTFWNVTNSLLPEWIDTLTRINMHLAQTLGGS